MRDNPQICRLCTARAAPLRPSVRDPLRDTPDLALRAARGREAAPHWADEKCQREGGGDEGVWGSQAGTAAFAGPCTILSSVSRACRHPNPRCDRNWMAGRSGAFPMALVAMIPTAQDHEKIRTREGITVPAIVIVALVSLGCHDTACLFMLRRFAPAFTENSLLSFPPFLPPPLTHFSASLASLPSHHPPHRSSRPYVSFHPYPQFPYPFLFLAFFLLPLAPPLPSLRDAPC